MLTAGRSLESAVEALALNDGEMSVRLRAAYQVASVIRPDPELHQLPPELADRIRRWFDETEECLDGAGLFDRFENPAHQVARDLVEISFEFTREAERHRP